MKQIIVNIPDGYELDESKSDLSKGKVFWKKLIPVYPGSVGQITGRDYFISASGKASQSYAVHQDINQVSSKARAEAFLALMQLVELRDAWNKVDGFKLNWGDSEHKFCIMVQGTVITRSLMTSHSTILAFGKMNTRDLFYKTFKNLIETAKELL